MLRGSGCRLRFLPAGMPALQLHPEQLGWGYVFRLGASGDHDELREPRATPLILFGALPGFSLLLLGIPIDDQG